MTEFRGRGPSPVRIVFDGQSMLNVPAAPNSMPTFLMSGRGIPWTAEPAIAGNGWADLTPTVATRLYPQARNRAGCVDILILSGGQGDIINSAPNGQQTGATTYARSVTYANNARAAGFDYVCTTTMPPIGPDVPLTGGRPTPGETAAIAAHNVLVLANSGGFDGVADISVAPLNDATNLAYFAADRTHLNPTGAAVAAGIVGSMLDTLLASL